MAVADASARTSPAAAPCRSPSPARRRAGRRARRPPRRGRRARSRRPCEPHVDADAPPPVGIGVAHERHLGPHRPGVQRCVRPATLRWPSETASSAGPSTAARAARPRRRPSGHASHDDDRPGGEGNCGRWPSTAPSAAANTTTPSTTAHRSLMRDRRSGPRRPARRPRRPSYRRLVAELLELGLADAAHVEQVVDRGERPVLLAMGDDRLGRGRADARELFELGGRGAC